MSTEIDWAALRTAAREAMAHAYVPYSTFPVGAAALVDDGRIVSGCNVENASYGLTLCAECGLVSALHASGGGRLVAFACVDGEGAALMPCGRCRQLLFEFGGTDLLVDLGPDSEPSATSLSDLLPRAFGPDNLSNHS
ncbi:cytidine deaminase [Catenulispora acidiphila DSM 44928]|uniref:Cytidine deaminase n=1 Tax=Catenulispora acidiphila (strain DSM 44928 / JCM 14897 / NBRC 102108 / NRRL B-24433 / ID139908) TaxID=479433 RepID=C7Q0U3_CATAD|nr:cytidine deaminase [Catenulispora acidiphila]ACU69721.1 cytidine deaminase [Catenulispora acidiphila DSM 44928]